MTRSSERVVDSRWASMLRARSKHRSLGARMRVSIRIVGVLGLRDPRMLSRTALKIAGLQASVHLLRALRLVVTRTVPRGAFPRLVLPRTRQLFVAAEKAAFA